MKIVTTSNLGLTILLGCTLGMGAIGWYGSQRLADLLSYVLGAAWQTADGAMEGSIELGNQSLYIQKMLRGMPLDEPELQRAKQAATDALQRVEEGKLIDTTAISTMNQHEQTYQQQQEKLLTLYRTFTGIDQALRASSERMSRLSTQLEVIGDGAVESLTQSPDQAISWNGGLSTRWQAADGGMEANIGFLRQLYALEKMQSEGPTPAIQTELAEANRFYQEAVDGMLATGLFDVPGEGEFAGQSLSTQYRALLADSTRLTSEWIAALTDYQRQLALYESSAEQLKQALVEVEAQGDATVEDQVNQLNTIIGYTKNLILGGLVLSLLIVTLCGFWLVRTIVNPLLQVDKRMQDIAAGDGDLNARINLKRDDELGSLAGSVDRFIEKLQKMISSTMDNNQHISDHVHTSVNRVEAISQSSRQTAEHAQALHHDSEQMVQVATSISDNCSLAAQNANQVRQLTTESSQYVASASAGMQRVVVEVGECANAINALKEQASQIGQIISTISSISEQTNLLALNAAIEAARAGEMGRGFAVVADEVRTLANRTAASSAEITEVINSIQQQTEKAYLMMQRNLKTVESGMEDSDNTKQILFKVEEAIDHLADMVQQVADATGQLSRTLSHTSDKVSGISLQAQTGEQEAQECLQLASSLHQASLLQQRLLSQFRV
ncbi:chemotaxis protein [Aeromonas salmonicida subsp. salmonicida]|uniref:Methyl-accepting chemotaxis protein n=1 Tax=Aeromonas salmonicida (strain A449) TaxID=382245 RepID=A4SJ24_AERS4|nr:methyl-accepting chemotaxis protein [Aeromonas salmonicida]ABO88896.1 methyl-accepting chemotaxis protein [Aeromonas salmonicida subsp. salmonicida A449]AYO62031.1 methyl-accepting chemotaxis protein [Aeromonas salmonicida subsp. salmonicida 01-B526]EKP0238551.1 methyl-accepting chemotaxis protein [Aeromonas salmonicida]EKP0242734.1 methyl-accepting chemotaxis protein [Aeromonas salmonicida]EKP0251011.1 methyl-accepting chemotaxis protein [Aeromonas salmonicida]